MTLSMKWMVTGLMCFLSACRLFGQLPTDPAATKPIPPFTVPPVQPGVAYERFIILGDFGTTVPNAASADELKYAADQKAVASAMAMRAKSDGLNFMITVGDNFYEDGVKSVDDPMFQSAFVDVYSGPALQVPTYASLGNHDHKGNVQAQIDYSAKNKNWIMPARYYTFTRTLGDGTKAAFFAIDTDPIKKKADVTAQIAWLDQELGKSDARWKFVFGHHPLYSHSARDREAERKTMRDAIEEILVKHKVDAFFAGHDHTLEMPKTVKGVAHVISGGGAGPKKAYGVEWTDESHYAATLGGYVLCRLSKSELVIEFIRLDGKTQYAHILSK